MNVSFTLVWTHVVYWFIAVGLVVLTRRLRLKVEAIATQLEGRS